MKPKIRKILEDCIEVGVVHGLEKAHKHTDNPTRPLITESIENAIWLEIDEHFDFELPLSVYDIGWK